MSQVLAARAALLAVVARYAPVHHQSLRNDAAHALNKAMDDLQAATIADAKAPVPPPPVSPAGQPGKSLEDHQADLEAQNRRVAREQAAAANKIADGAHKREQGIHRRQPPAEAPPSTSSPAPTDQPAASPDKSKDMEADPANTPSESADDLKKAAAAVGINIDVLETSGADPANSVPVDDGSVSSPTPPRRAP